MFFLCPVEILVGLTSLLLKYLLLRKESSDSLFHPSYLPLLKGNTAGQRSAVMSGTLDHRNAVPGTQNDIVSSKFIEAAVQTVVT